MLTPSRLLPLAFAALSLAATALQPAAATALQPAAAADWRPTTVFVEGGIGQEGLGAAAVGVSWPFDWSNTLWGGKFTAATELSLSHWSARDFGGGHQSYTWLSLVPVLRYRFDEGRSPWFVEGGIGLTVSDKLYSTPNKTFSTEFNFSDNIAVGRSFGADGRHELSLRLQHISNADIKKPNPGEELLQLRYAVRF